MSYVHMMQAIWAVGTVIVIVEIFILHRRLKTARRWVEILEKRNKVGGILIVQLRQLQREAEKRRQDGEDDYTMRMVM
jgi:hypothetical protein